MQEGNTPLHLAAERGDEDIVNDLLEAMGPEKSTYILKKNQVGWDGWLFGGEWRI